MCHHPLLFLRLESLSHRQVHILPGWVIWCSIMQMTSSILALLKLVIKSMTYGYSSIRGTNTLYVKYIGFVEMQCASEIWYEADNISSCLLQCGWCELCTSCGFHNHDVASPTDTFLCVQPLLNTGPPKWCCPLELTLNSFVRSSTAPAPQRCQVCGKTPEYALLMTCQKGRASYASA